MPVAASGMRIREQCCHPVWHKYVVPGCRSGCPEAVGSAPFTDLKQDAYYYRAVVWACENGYAKGTSDTAFLPDLQLTRGEAVTFLYRFCGSEKTESTSPFTDVDKSSYCYDPVNWGRKRKSPTVHRGLRSVPM